jgi:hypothetical protein
MALPVSNRRGVAEVVPQAQRNGGQVDATAAATAIGHAAIVAIKDSPVGGGADDLAFDACMAIFQEKYRSVFARDRVVHLRPAHVYEIFQASNLPLASWSGFRSANFSGRAYQPEDQSERDRGHPGSSNHIESRSLRRSLFLAAFWRSYPGRRMVTCQACKRRAHVTGAMPAVGTMTSAK